MASVKEGQKQPALTTMGLALGMQDALAKESRFGRRGWPLPIMILIRDQHMFDIGWMVEDIDGGVTLPQEELADLTHRKFDHIAVGLTVQQKAQGIPEELGESSPPAGDRRAGTGGWRRHLIDLVNRPPS